MRTRKGRTGEAGTREQILQAALEEFSANGFSGARIDRITRKADVNVRMIYHFFGSKRGLLDAVLGQIFRERRELLAKPPASFEQLLDAYFNGYAADQHRVRLLEWEALEAGADPDKLNALDDRKKVVSERIASLRALQEEGKMPAEIDPQMLYLFCVALSIYPMSFPQSVFVSIGEEAHSAQFQQRYRDALASLARLLTPSLAQSPG